jgi:FkbM family methyltransferase
MRDLLRGIWSSVARVRSAFRNWVEITVVAGLGGPSALPPRDGLRALAGRRLRLRTRLGPVLETSAANASPVIEVFAYGEYDLPLEWPRLRTVLDVGAHVGAFAAWSSCHAPQAKVISVEPEPRNFRDLEGNVARNGLSDRVTCMNVAVGSERGVMELRVPSYRESGSMFATSGATVEVKVVSLEELLETANGTVDLLKLDCEGAEWSIVEELPVEVWRAVDRMVLECHAQAGRSIDDMVGLLEGRGFTAHVLHRAPSSVEWFDEVGVIWAERLVQSSSA